MRQNKQSEPFTKKISEYIFLGTRKALYLQSEIKNDFLQNILNYKTMTKSEVVNEISKKTGVDKAEALKCVEAFMEVVKESLINEENVYLRGFGSFILKKRAQKTARNISKNTTIVVPEHNIPAFKPAKTFAVEVKK